MFEIQAERGANIHFAAHENIAAGLLDNAVAGGQAQPRAAAHFFGREKRFEDVFEDFKRNAGAGILHFHQHILAGGDDFVFSGCVEITGKIIDRSDDDVTGTNGELAAIFHRVARIDGEIDNNLFQLSLISLHHAQITAMLHFHLDVFANQSANQVR